jgi:hypothetical protein
MKYELECRRWSQGPINRLKGKGLVFLPETQPLSRFVMALRSVETPKPLVDKAVELYEQLQRMGRVALGERDRRLTAATYSNPPPSRPSTAPKEVEEEEVEEEEASKSPPSASLTALPDQLLLSMVEPREGAWCSLQAAVEDLLLQAAFLVVPHREEPSPSTAKRKEKKEKMEEEEMEMGNAAFRRHCEHLQRLASETARREAVRRRFRAAFILVTPFCLALKSQQVFTVGELLRRGLGDLDLPAALHTQLEVLLASVVARAVMAKSVPVPRSLLPSAEALFTVPLTYDPKFQRSPLDPFGRPPRLVPEKGSRREREKERGEEALPSLHGAVSIASDLTDPISLWAPRTMHSSKKGQGEREGEREGDPQWAFLMGSPSSALDPEDAALVPSEQTSPALPGPQSPSPSLVSSSSPSPSLARRRGTLGEARLQPRDAQDLRTMRLQEGLAAEEGDGDEEGGEQGEGGGGGSGVSVYRVIDLKESSSLRITSYSATTALSPFTSTHSRSSTLPRSRSSRGTASQLQLSSSPPPPSQPMQRQRQRQKPPFVNVAEPPSALSSTPFEDGVYKQTLRCTYPHCNQVFSRMYTYKVHLRSHERFGQYHEFKRQPQLLLDLDRRQVRQLEADSYAQRVALPPIEGALRPSSSLHDS